MENVLFLCTGNSCRSQMAEALLRKYGADRFNAYSAGSEPKGVHPLTIKVLQEKGIDTSKLRSKNVSEFLGKLPVHYLIVVCDNANQSCPRIVPGMLNREFWPFDDPPAFQGTDEEKLNKFRGVQDAIDKRVQQWLVEQPK